jgi:hypothetical protein
LFWENSSIVIILVQPAQAQVSDEIAIDLAGMGGLETDIIADRDLHRTMAEQQPHKFVIALLVLEDDGRRKVPELMHGQTQTDRFFDEARDLIAQR